MTQTTTAERDNAAPETNTKTAAHLSIETIRKWNACGDGRNWFREKFPQGGDYHDVMLALYADGRNADANWLASTMLSRAPSAAFISADVLSIVDLVRDAATTGNRAHAATTGYEAHAATTGDEAHAATTGNRAHAATTGDWAHAATTGNRAHAATTGDWAHAATTGNRAHAATTGNEAHAATTGNEAHAATTGDGARAATTGDEAHAATTGKNCIVAALGMNSRIQLGENGCGTLHWHDGSRYRAVTIYAGEGGIEAGVWYRADETGAIISVEAE